MAPDDEDDDAVEIETETVLKLEHSTKSSEEAVRGSAPPERDHPEEGSSDGKRE